MKRAVCALLCVGLWTLHATSALAQDDGKDLEAARKHFQNAIKAERAGKWADAAHEYEAAYNNSKDPVVFYRVANAFDKAGDCESALPYYRKYLDQANPSKSFKKITNDRIKKCEDKVAAAAAANQGNDGNDGNDGNNDGNAGDGNTGDGNAGDSDGGDTSGGDELGGDTDGGDELGGDTSGGDELGGDDGLGGDTGSPDPVGSDEPSRARTAAWISVGLVIAFGTTGAVLGLAAQARQDDIDSQIDFRDFNGNPARFEGNNAERYQDLIDQGNRLELLSYISYGAAIAAAGAATLFFVLDDDKAASGERDAAGLSLAPAVGRESVGVSATWRFH